MPKSDDELLDKTPTRRISDVQMGVIIEKMRNTEKCMVELGAKFDHWTEKFEQQCEHRHADVAKVVSEVRDKASREQLDNLKDIVSSHTTYWALLISISTLGTGIVYTVYKLMGH